MSYVSGTATNIPDLLTQVKAFLIAEGWTIERFDATSIETTRSVTRTPGAISRGFGFGFASGVDMLGGGTGTYVICVPWESFSSAFGFVWYNQAGAPVSATGSKYLGVAAPCASSNIAYHFFSDDSGEVMTLVFERTAGVFNYLGFGMLRDSDKFGTWDGYQYAFGARGMRESDGRIVDTAFGTHHAVNVPPLPPGYRRQVFSQPTTLIQVDSDGSGVEWRSCSGPNYDSTFRTSRVISGWVAEVSGTRDSNVQSVGGLPSLLHPWVRSRSALANNMVVLPCNMSAYRSATQRWSPLCRLPQVRTCFTSGVLNEGAQFLIGADTYRAFNSYAVQEVP